MKTILIALAAVLVIGGGYYWYANSSETMVKVEDKTEVKDETIEKNNTAGGAKLNINAVCEGALAYMSFEDGESAAAFVAECKEGKHPEVIERYKAEMNLGDGATI